MNIFWSLLGVFSTIGGIIAYVTTQKLFTLPSGFLFCFARRGFVLTMMRSKSITKSFWSLPDARYQLP
jgi:hypothetical protein